MWTTMARSSLYFRKPFTFAVSLFKCKPTDPSLILKDFLCVPISTNIVIKPPLKMIVILKQVFHSITVIGFKYDTIISLEPCLIFIITNNV